MKFLTGSSVSLTGKAIYLQRADYIMFAAAKRMCPEKITLFKTISLLAGKAEDNGSNNSSQLKNKAGMPEWRRRVSVGAWDSWFQLRSCSQGHEMEPASGSALSGESA